MQCHGCGLLGGRKEEEEEEENEEEKGYKCLYGHDQERGSAEQILLHSISGAMSHKCKY